METITPMKGETFIESRNGNLDFFILTDAEKCLNGMPIKERELLRMSRANRGISSRQMIPIHSLSEMLTKPGPKIVDQEMHSAAGLQRYHYAFPVELVDFARVKVVTRPGERPSYYTDFAKVGEPSLIDDLKQWDDPEFCWEVVEADGLNLNFVDQKYQTQELIKMALENNPYAIAFVEQQTAAHWEQLLNHPKCNQLYQLLRFYSLTDPVIYRQVIAQQLERLKEAIGGSDKSEVVAITKCVVSEIGAVIEMAPTTVQSEIRAELPDKLASMVPETVVPISGDEVMKTRRPQTLLADQRDEDQLVCLIPPDGTVAGQFIGDGLNRLNSRLSKSQRHGFWVMKVSTALEMINSHSLELSQPGPFSSRLVRYYFEEISFVTLPPTARVYRLDDARFPGVMVTDQMVVARKRKLDDFYLWRLNREIDLVSRHGYLLKYVVTQTATIKTRACSNCPRALYQCRVPNKQCMMAAVLSYPDASGLRLHPEPPKQLKDKIATKFSVPVSELDQFCTYGFV